MSPLSMQASADQFAAACKALEIGARLNASAISAACDAFDHSDEEERHFAPQAVAFGFQQLVQLHRQLLLLAIGMEIAAAEAVAAAES